jgi:hypothetical protein
MLPQGGATARHERNKLVGQAITTKSLVIKETDTYLRIGVRIEELVKFRDVPADPSMGMRLESWIEGAQVETYRYHAPCASR